MKAFSRSWISSKTPKKQRKYRAHAPLHLRRQFLAAHLSKDLRTKYKRRSFPLHKGDTVTIMTGQYRKKSGKVEALNRKRSKIYITGIGVQKRDGSLARYPIAASNVVITELNLEDKQRKHALTRMEKTHGTP